MLTAKGTIISQIIKDIKPKPGGNQFDPFKVKTMWISDGHSRPLEIQSTLINGTKPGDKVDMEIWIKMYKGNKPGYTLQGVTERN